GRYYGDAVSEVSSSARLTAKFCSSLINVVLSPTQKSATALAPPTQHSAVALLSRVRTNSIISSSVLSSPAQKMASIPVFFRSSSSTALPFVQLICLTSTTLFPRRMLYGSRLSNSTSSLTSSLD